MSRPKSNYDGLQEANEMRLIGLFFRNMDDTITAEEKKDAQFKRLKSCFLQLMFPCETSKSTYHYL